MRWILANFKMNKNARECREWAETFRDLITRTQKPKANVGCAPSFPYIMLMREMFSGTNVLVGAQNMHHEEKGAFTGEVSVAQLKDLGAQFVIIGHSERRHIFGEKDELIARKLQAALKKEITPVLCIGETLEERNSGKTFEVLEGQLRVLEGVRGSKGIVIAYEPVWAIGTGVPAKKEQINEAVSFVRERARAYIENFSVLYGGSIDEKVAEEIADICDGGLVGSASLDPARFFKICVAFDI